MKSDPSVARVFHVTASSTEAYEAAEQSLHAAIDLLMPEDYERVVISISARPRGYAEARRQKAEKRRALRRQAVLEKIQRGQRAMLDSLGLQEVPVQVLDAQQETVERPASFGRIFEGLWRP